MTRIHHIMIWLAVLLAAGCLESNPQPSPVGTPDVHPGVGGDIGYEAADVLADTTRPQDSGPLEDTADDGNAETADVPVDTLPELPDTTAQDTAQDLTGDGDTGPEDTAADVCEPECGGKECGDDGCGGSCGTCPAESCCVDGLCGSCGGLVSLEPACVHVPFMVPAGAPAPVAFLDLNSGCAQYDHADIQIDGSSVHVELVGIDPGGACPPCIFNMLGMVWIDGLAPGPYMVQVGSAPPQYMVATAGDIPSPACQDDCALPLGEGWILSFMGDNPQPDVGCSDYSNMNAPITLGGGCQDYTMGCDAWPGPSDLFLCSDQDVFFDLDGDENYMVTASRFVDPMGWGDTNAQVILGIDLSGLPDAATVFLFEKDVMF